jgi:hypothetical protein
VGAAGTQSRLTSASRSFLRACSHTHSQLPRGSALFLPHPETLTPSEYPGGKKKLWFSFCSLLPWPAFAVGNGDLFSRRLRP